MMFAVIKTGGKQYRVAAKDVLQVDRLEAEPGAVVEFGEVLVVGGDAAGGEAAGGGATIVGTPTVAGGSVAAEVLDHVRGAKVIAFKKRRRKNSRRKRGHRQQFSLVRITEILTQGRRPSPGPPSAAEEPLSATADAAAADDRAAAAAATAPPLEDGGAATAEGASADAASPAGASADAAGAAATGIASSAEKDAVADDKPMPEGGGTDNSN